MSLIVAVEPSTALVNRFLLTLAVLAVIAAICVSEIVVVLPANAVVGLLPITILTFASLVVTLVENELEANVRFFVTDANEPEPASLAFTTSVMVST